MPALAPNRSAHGDPRARQPRARPALPRQHRSDRRRGAELPAAWQIGEPAISGLQLAIGYLYQPELTAARFPVIDGTRWYLTGDVAYQHNEGRFHHLGRCNGQIKVRGHRVELGDVESHLRQVCGTDLAAAVAWPFADGAATGIVGFVVAPADDRMPSRSEIRAALERRLPGYIVP